MKNNEKKIKPIQALTPRGIKTINVIQFKSFSNYDFEKSGGSVNYSLGEYVEGKFMIYSGGVCVLPKELVDSWLDDEPIYDFVISQKGFERDTN